MSQKQNTLVLVADDEPSMLALVSAFVRSKGYTVIEASDGDMAWQLAHERLPDLVILDVMMPGMSGWEVCRKIREAVSLAHTGVIMLTGIGENLNEMTSPLYGADNYIDKPFEFAELERGITETLKKRKKGVFGRADGADQVSEGDVGDDIPASIEPVSEAPPKRETAKKEKAKPALAKATPKKKAVTKKAAKKAATKKAVAKKVGKKTLSKKAAAKKTVTKKAVAKKAAPKKVSKRTLSKKAAAKKAVAKKAAKKASASKPKPVKAARAGKAKAAPPPQKKRPAKKK
jgi:DNA-binding response OmpR family regulator